MCCLCLIEIKQVRRIREIVKTSSDTLAVEKDTISQNKFDSEIDIRQVELEHANLIFDDRNTEVYSRIDDVDLRLKLALTKGISSLGVEFWKIKNIHFFGSKVNY